VWGAEQGGGGGARGGACGGVGGVAAAREGAPGPAPVRPRERRRGLRPRRQGTQLGHALTRDSGMLSHATRTCSHTRLGHALTRDSDMLSHATRTCSHTRLGHALTRDSDMLSHATRICLGSVCVRAALSAYRRSAASGHSFRPLGVWMCGQGCDARLGCGHTGRQASDSGLLVAFRLFQSPNSSIRIKGVLDAFGLPRLLAVGR
jgi:hypothetical protein